MIRPCPEQNKGALINKLLEQFRHSVSHPFYKTSRIWMPNILCSMHNFRHVLGTHAQSSNFPGKACYMDKHKYSALYDTNFIVLPLHRDQYIFTNNQHFSGSSAQGFQKLPKIHHSKLFISPSIPLAEILSFL